MAKKIKTEADVSTEEKIKEAARKVFTSKGYAGTRTRDIAEEAGINLALLNYYFRSKDKLFEIIMQEKLQQFMFTMIPVLNDSGSDIEEKLTVIASNYIDMILTQPDLPIFVLSEIRNHPERFIKTTNIKKTLVESHFFRQILEKTPEVNPLHIIMNLLGMVIFPFVGRPILQTVGSLTDDEFARLMLERKKLVPRWIKLMLEPQ